MNIILISLVIVSFLVAITSAIVILFRNFGSPVHRWLALFLIFAGSWGFIVNLLSPRFSLETNVWIVRATFIAAIFMTYAMVRFVTAFTQMKVTAVTRYLLGAATIIIAALMTTPLVIPAVSLRGSVVVAERLPIYYAVIVFILFLCGLALYLLFTARRRARTHFARQQLTAIFGGLLGGIALGGLTNIILPNVLGSLAPARYAWLAILVWTVSLVYTVVRHKFLDIRLTVVRTAAYVLSLLSLAAIYYIIAFAVSRIILRDSLPIEPLDIGIALVLAFLFQPTKRFFDKLTNRLFYRDNYDSGAFFVELSRILTLTTDLRSLLERAANHIGGTLKAEQASFFIRYNGTSYISAGTRQRKKIPADDVRVLDTYVDAENADLVVGELTDDNAVRRMLVSHKIAIVLPLRHGEVLIGYLFLGDQRSSGYTQRDLRILKSIPNELVIAIQNALSVQEVRELNATLQQRIDEATRELRLSNDQLRRLDEAKDEFVSMASHQLRTPLTSVKGYISMMLEGDAGKINDMQKHFLGEAFTSSERMVHLINDFLNVSRLQTGKFIIDRHQVDLAHVTVQEVDSLRMTASQRQLSLKLKIVGKIPILYLDESKIRQVMMNFIDNALYYSKEGTTIMIELRRDGEDVVLTVKDTGIGVPAGEQARLFTKFYRASNARKQRPDGTGVGLFLAKKVIVSHGGSMVFESSEGKGSTFGFRLPIAKLNRAPAGNPDDLDN